jgi:signal peptidase
MSKLVRVLVFGILLGVVVASVISLVLYMYAGVWPALVTVTSGSMEPNISQGDLILVSEPNNIETYSESNRENFGKPGDVIVFYPDGNKDTTIIHRAMIKVDKGENWYEEANPEYFSENISHCNDLTNCPAPKSGYITKGDNNDVYDQSAGRSIVQKEHIFAESDISISSIGYIYFIIPIIMFTIGSLLIIKGLNLTTQK